MAKATALLVSRLCLTRHAVWSHLLLVVLALNEDSQPLLGKFSRPQRVPDLPILVSQLLNYVLVNILELCEEV